MNSFSLFVDGLLREKDCEAQMVRIFFIIIPVLWLPYTIVYIFAKCTSALGRLLNIPYEIQVYPPKRSGICLLKDEHWMCVLRSSGQLWKLDFSVCGAIAWTEPGLQGMEPKRKEVYFPMEIIL